MLPVILFLLIAIPLVELYVIVQVAHQIGIFETVVVLVAVSVCGAWLLKRQGTATWGALQETMRRGEMPTKHLADGALIVLGGALLLTPGFVTDAAGLILLLPPTRAVLKGGVRRLLGGWARRRFMGDAGERIYSATVTNVRSRRGPDVTSRAGRRPPPAGRRLPDREDDSRDTG